MLNLKLLKNKRYFPVCFSLLYSVLTETDSCFSWEIIGHSVSISPCLFLFISVSLHFLSLLLFSFQIPTVLMHKGCKICFPRILDCKSGSSNRRSHKIQLQCLGAKCPVPIPIYHAGADIILTALLQQENKKLTNLTDTTIPSKTPRGWEIRVHLKPVTISATAQEGKELMWNRDHAVHKQLSRINCLFVCCL